ncbi:hypothetical protein FRC09_016955, partial [Ceratobasidium sp. 395]
MTSAEDFHLISWKNFGLLAAVVVGVLIPVGLRWSWKRELDEAGEDEVRLAGGPAVGAKGKKPQPVLLASDDEDEGEYVSEERARQEAARMDLDTFYNAPTRWWKARRERKRLAHEREEDAALEALAGDARNLPCLVPPPTIMVPNAGMLHHRQAYRFEHPHEHPPHPHGPPLPPPHALPPPPQPMTPVQSMASTSSLSPPPKSVPRKRRKTEDEPPRDRSQAEPRRLRRLHEACARCRGKKIKCDSKHPNCGACESAGVECKQEDRHRQTLQPRGHLEHLETQLSKCRALLGRLVSNFDVEHIDRHLDDAGVRWSPAYPEVQTPAGAYTQPFFPAPATPTPSSTPRPDERSPFAAPPPRVDEIKGSDPNNNDLSSTRGLSNSFGVARVITKNLPTEASPEVREDLAVEGYIAGGPPDGHAPPVLNPVHWQHSSITRSTKAGAPPEPPIEIWLPHDQARAFKIVDVYFRNLEFA